MNATKTPETTEIMEMMEGLKIATSVVHTKAMR